VIGTNAQHRKLIEAQIVTRFLELIESADDSLIVSSLCGIRKLYFAGRMPGGRNLCVEELDRGQQLIEGLAMHENQAIAEQARLLIEERVSDLEHPPTYAF
jgi:hypothetical protein